MSVEFIDHAELPAAAKGFRCPGCRRPLAMDTGVGESGMPSCWARCHTDRGGCGRVWCAFKHEIRPNAASWEPGRTGGEGTMVAVCIEGSCKRLRVEYERMLTAFDHTPGGQATRDGVAKLKARATGQDGFWLTISAQYLLGVARWFVERRPELRRAESAAREAEFVSARPKPAHVVAGLSYAEWEQREREAKAARVEASARRELELKLAFERGASIDEIFELTT